MKQNLSYSVLPPLLSSSSSKKFGGRAKGSSKKSSGFGLDAGRSICGMTGDSMGDWGGEKNWLVGPFGVLNVKNVVILIGGNSGEGVAASKCLTVQSFNSR